MNNVKTWSVAKEARVGFILPDLESLDTDFLEMSLDMTAFISANHGQHIHISLNGTALADEVYPTQLRKLFVFSDRKAGFAQRSRNIG